jgi:LAO/AO transport system kinase
MSQDLGNLLEGVRNRDRSSLARALSLLERYPDVAHLLPRERGGHATVVGVAGPPGAGKSTLLGRVAAEITMRDMSVAVLAFDPVSPRSGGALLGDRIRMLDAAEHPNVYVRSIAARDPAGSPALPALLAVLDLYGFDFVFLEAVGAGQEASPLLLAADLALLVLVPGLGDSVQTLKAGVLEIADLIVINKSDRPGAAELVRDLSAYYRLLADTSHSVPPILQTVGSEGQGITAVLEAITELRDRYAASGILEERRRRAATRLWQHTLRTRCLRIIDELLNDGPAPDDGDPEAGTRERQLYRKLAERFALLAASSDDSR